MQPTLVRQSRRSLETPGGRAIRACGLALLLAILPATAEGQERGQVIGQVQSAESGAPLSQVQVYLEGTGVGTLSNQSGRFILLNVPAGEYQLRAQRIGLRDVTRDFTLQAGQTLELNLQMTSEALGLDEIVVTGAAGAARRREIGNSIAQINVDQVPDRPTQVSQILQSAAPGIDVTSAGGEIGQGSRIQLRGQSSLSMTNQPIIYVDGVRMMSGALPMTGAPDYRPGRGANVTVSPLDQINPNDIERIEVIKGSAATTLYGTEASAGVIQVFTKSGSVGAPVWTVETQQGTGWSRQFGVDPVPYNYMEPWLRSGWLGIGDGDWGTMHNQQYSASVRGGGTGLQYFVSGQFEDQTGLMPLDAAEKYTVRGNFVFSPVQGLEFQWNSAYSNQWQQNTPSGNNSNGLTLNVFRQDQNYFGSADPDLIRQILDYDVQQTVERFTSGGTVNYTPTGNFSNRFTIGYDFTQQEARNLRPFGFVAFPQGGLLNNTFSNRLLTFDYVGTYRFTISNSIRSSVSWGGQAVGEEKITLEAWGEQFPGATAPTINSAAITLGFEERERVWNAGFFLQNVFDFSDKYFLTLGGRVDGHSAFGEGFGLQFYPKAGATWVMSDEDFWPDAWGDFRLRTAYGQSGRAPGAFDAVRTWNPLSWAGVPAFVPQNVGNPNLGPEVSEEIEVGFEASWFEGRVRPEFTYFRQRTKDALLNMPQIQSMGFTGSQQMNIGELASEGVEVGIQTSPIQQADWGWDLGVNLSFMSNEIIDLGGLPSTPTLEEGLPLRPMVTWLVTNPDEIAAPQFEADHFYGPTHPTQMFSANTTVRMPGGVSLSATGEYRGGHYLSQGVFSIGRSVRSPLCFPYYAAETGVDLVPDTPALWRARCTPTWGRGYVYKADYFKLRSVSAQIPMDFAFPDRVSGASLTLALNNSYLWMREMPFMDPEMLGNEGVNSESTGFTERVPSPITLRVSLRVTF
jgi:TonB-dependent starch-binding outer membrane protein SusC